MSEEIYTVHAYRWGDRACHSYLVGVYANDYEAIHAGREEEEWRGGKYECEICKFVLGAKDENDPTDPQMPREIIKPLTEIPRNKRPRAAEER